jgi:hypothetical protein
MGRSMSTVSGSAGGDPSTGCVRTWTLRTHMRSSFSVKSISGAVSSER